MVGVGYVGDDHLARGEAGVLSTSACQRYSVAAEGCPTGRGQRPPRHVEVDVGAAEGY